MSLKSLRQQGGFTLLELLIVIVIIGILGLLIIPNIIDAPKKNRDTQRKTDLRAVQKGLEEYFVANNSYPTQATTAVLSTSLAATLSKAPNPIIKPLPVDPNHTSTTPYTYTSDGKSYRLDACLEDAHDSGTDVVSKSHYTFAVCKTADFELVNSN